MISKAFYLIPLVLFLVGFQLWSILSLVVLLFLDGVIGFTPRPNRRYPFRKKRSSMWNSISQIKQNHVEKKTPAPSNHATARFRNIHATPKTDNVVPLRKVEPKIKSNIFDN